MFLLLTDDEVEPETTQLDTNRNACVRFHSYIAKYIKSEMRKESVNDVQIGEDLKSKKISNDQELIQSDPTSCPQNQKGNN